MIFNLIALFIFDFLNKEFSGRISPSLLNLEISSEMMCADKDTQCNSKAQKKGLKVPFI
jgi:hypothetical protein